MSAQQIPPLQILPISSIEDLADSIPRKAEYFTLFLAWDNTNVDHERLLQLFRPLVDRGLAYFCCWGQGCEETHDAVDWCAQDRESQMAPPTHILMTTWHDNESLEEALWFFKNVAFPAEMNILSNCGRFVVPVGNEEWTRRLKSLISK